MAEHSRSLKNSRVLVKDFETGDLLADTVIIEHDTIKNVITTAKERFGKGDNTKVSVLVFAPKGLLEYNGTIRKEISSLNTEIAIYKEKERNDRKYLRYEMSAEGNIDALFFNNKLVELRRSIVVHIKNISANGVLFQSGADEFEPKQIVRLNIDLKGKAFTQIYQILRIQNKTLATAEYGCKLVGVENVLNEVHYDESYFVADSKRGLEEFNYKHSLAEEEKGYTDIVYQVSRIRSMLAMSDIEKRPEQVNDVFSKIGSAIWSLYTDMIIKNESFTPEFVINCCSYKGDEVVAEARFVLNITLLAMLLARPQIDDEERIRNLVKTGICIGYAKVQEMFDDSQINSILQASQIYNYRASKQSGTAVVPLSGLEQMYACGENETEEGVRRQERKLALFFRNTLKDGEVYLADGGCARVIFVPTNDMSHPIFMREEYYWQSQGANNVIGFRNVKSNMDTIA